jgi:acyl-CoA synthetase (AMP-forming)/AMP-acid ligase II
MSSGENIYAAAVEAALDERPDVAEGAIVGVPNDALRRGRGGRGAAPARGDGRRRAEHAA